MSIYLRTLVAISVFASVPAVASPVALKVQEPQLRRFERSLKGQTLAVQRDLVEQEGMACFDPVGVQNLDLQTTVTDVSITPAPQGGRLDLSISLAKIDVRGIVFAEGSFICPDVEETLDPLTMNDVHVTASVAVSVKPNGSAELVVMSTTATVGDITITGSDTLDYLEEEWGLISSFVPSMVDMAAAQGVVYANEMIESYRTGMIMGIPYAVKFTHADILANAIVLEATMDPGTAEKGECLAADATPPTLTSVVASAPALPAGFSPESGVLMSTSSDLPGNILAAAWWAGFFCGEMKSLVPPEALKETIELITGMPMSEVDVRYSLTEAPRVRIEGGMTYAEIVGAHVEITDASGMVLFLADMDLHAGGSATIDPDTRLALANVDLASVTIHRLESVLADGEEGRLEMKAFIEDKLPGQIVAGMQGQPVGDGVVLDPMGRLIVEVIQADSGFIAAASPYLEWDPEVDPIAPETSIGNPRERDWDEVEFELQATDDRAGTLVYSWALDDGPWSAWTTETEVVVTVAPGNHRMQAMSRDRWGNVDASPAAFDFTVDDSRTVPGCACSTTAGPAPRPLIAIVLTAVAFVAIRRRRLSMAAAAPAIALLVLAPAAARADDTRVLPPKIFILSLTAVQVENNPPSSVTGSTVAIPTGMMPIGIDARAKEQHRMSAQLYVPTLVVGVYKNVNVIAFLPIFQRAEVEVQKFEVHAAGVNVTSRAQEELRTQGFKTPTGDKPISTWRGRGVGDLGLAVRWRAYGDRQQALAITGGVKVPTGRQDDPRILTDFGFGEGQWDVSTDVAGERRLDRFVLGGIAGYKLKLPGETQLRPVGGPTITTVKDPGDVMRAGISARNSGAGMPWYSLSGGVALEHHLADTNSAHIPTPDQRGTAAVVSASVGVSNIKLFMKHRFLVGLPMMLSVGAQRSIPLTGNDNLDLWQGTARLDLIL